MTLKITGYVLIILGISGFLFFEDYEISLIPNAFIWLMVSIVIALAGGFLLYVVKVLASNEAERYLHERTT